MITLIGLLLSIKSTENHQRAKGQVMGTPAHNENTKCLVFNTLTVWLKYQFNNTFEQEISVLLLTIFIETIIHLVYPPKILHEHCLRFVLGRLQYSGENGNNGYVFFLWGWGGGRG